MSSGSVISTVSFHANRLVVSNLLANKAQAEVECGGGQRSWDIHAGKEIVYIKEKRIYTQRLGTDGELSAFSGSHTQQINTILPVRYSS